jgi:hypothetical protein
LIRKSLIGPNDDVIAIGVIRHSPPFVAHHVDLSMIAPARLTRAVALQPGSIRQESMFASAAFEVLVARRRNHNIGIKRL